MRLRVALEDLAGLDLEEHRVVDHQVRIEAPNVLLVKDDVDSSIRPGAKASLAEDNCQRVAANALGKSGPQLGMRL